MAQLPIIAGAPNSSSARPHCDPAADLEMCYRACRAGRLATVNTCRSGDRRSDCRGSALWWWRLLFRRVVVLRHFGPVNDVPDRLQIIRTPILVFQIVGVLPHVHAQDRFAFTTRDGFAHERAVL